MSDATFGPSKSHETSLLFNGKPNFKCNRIDECKDRIDEDDCQSDESRVLIATLVVFAVILLIWILIYYVYDNNETMDDISKEEKEHAQSAKGDTLALLKVAVELSHIQLYLFIIFFFHIE